MYCTHVSVWSLELSASAAAMCCAPSAPMELDPRLYAHVYVRRAIQRTYAARDARSHTHNRVRTCMQTARSTSVRRSAEAHEGIAQGYARFGDLLTAVVPYACAARRFNFLHSNYRAHYRTHAHRLRTAHAQPHCSAV
jgi:hypothetical protein